MVKNKKYEELFNSIYSELHKSLTYKDTFQDVDENSGLVVDVEVLIPEPILLSDVLAWHSMCKRNKYSHFEVIKGIGYFSVYDSEETYNIPWDLSKRYLEEQSDEMLDWLTELI